MTRTGIAVFAAAILSLTAACVPMTPGVQEASTRGGDYTILDCSELSIAAGSVRQRLATISGGGAAAFGAVTPAGVRVKDRAVILQDGLEDIEAKRIEKGCEVSAPIVTAAEVLEQPEPARTEFFGPARFLQVGTFEIEYNSDVAISALRDAGVDAYSRAVTLNGFGHWRVVAGPLTSAAEVEAADAVARRLGLNDAFFVGG